MLERASINIGLLMSRGGSGSIFTGRFATFNAEPPRTRASLARRGASTEIDARGPDTREDRQRASTCYGPLPRRRYLPAPHHAQRSRSWVFRSLR